MKITYDASVGAAYIYLTDDIEPGGVARTYCCDPQEVKGLVNLDFDSGGRLIGIEVLDASELLPEIVLQNLLPKGQQT